MLTMLGVEQPSWEASRSLCWTKRAFGERAEDHGPGAEAPYHGLGGPIQEGGLEDVGYMGQG